MPTWPQPVIQGGTPGGSGPAPQALCDVFAKNGVSTCSTFLLLHFGAEGCPMAVLCQRLDSVKHRVAVTASILVGGHAILPARSSAGGQWRATTTRQGMEVDAPRPLRGLATYPPVLPGEWRGGLVEAPSLWLARPPCQFATRLISPSLLTGTTRVASSTMSRRSPFDWTSTLRKS
jgi:hypothetical protein